MKRGFSELAFTVPGAAFIAMVLIIIAAFISPNMFQTMWLLLVNNNGITF